MVDERLRSALLEAADAGGWLRTAGVAAAVEAGSLAPRDGTADPVVEVAAANLEVMQRVVATFGWPDATLVGEDGAAAAFALTINAAADPIFLRRCLTLLVEAAEADRAPMWQVAALTDRVLLLETGHQRYGTQFTVRDGHFERRPLADPYAVDDRRRTAGLEPVDDYRRTLERHYHWLLPTPPPS